MPVLLAGCVRDEDHRLAIAEDVGDARIAVATATVARERSAPLEHGLEVRSRRQCRGGITEAAVGAEGIERSFVRITDLGGRETCAHGAQVVGENTRRHDTERRTEMHAVTVVDRDRRDQWQQIERERLRVGQAAGIGDLHRDRIGANAHARRGPGHVGAVQYHSGRTADERVGERVASVRVRRRQRADERRTDTDAFIRLRRQLRRMINVLDSDIKTRRRRPAVIVCHGRRELVGANLTRSGGPIEQRWRAQRGAGRCGWQRERQSVVDISRRGLQQLLVTGTQYYRAVGDGHDLRADASAARRSP